MSCEEFQNGVVCGAVAIAVGTMIGASIFSVFGLGARIAAHNLPFVFVLSGVLAPLVAYSYAKLGAKIVSNAGPIEFIPLAVVAIGGLLAGTVFTLLAVPVVFYLLYSVRQSLARD